MGPNTNEYEDLKFMSEHIGGVNSLAIHPKLANPFIDKFHSKGDHYSIN